MRTLINCIEGLLDSDFDIKDSDVFTLKHMGFKCTNMSANDNWGPGMDDTACNGILGVEISQANRKGHNPYNGFDQYVKSEMVFHHKVSAGRDGMGFGKWRFAWMIRLVLDCCNDNPDEIEKTLKSCMSTKVHGLDVSVRKMKNKIIIKMKHIGMWGPASMSMTLTKE